MSLATAPGAAVVEVVEVSVADLAGAVVLGAFVETAEPTVVVEEATFVVVVACTVVLVVVVAVVAVVAGGPTETGAVLQPAIVNDEQSLANKFFIRPNSLWSIDKPQRAFTDIQSPRNVHQ